jgi:hypothetical protein
MKHIKEYENFLNESGFKKSDITKAVAYIKKEIGTNPGYALIGDDDDIEEFDNLWNAKKYDQAFDLLAAATNMEITDLEDIKNILDESASLNEGRSIEKIQYDWTKLTTSMQATALNWKAAEGKAKDMLLGKLKDMTAKKKQLEAELDAAIASKDKDLELVVSESITEKLNVDIVAKKWDELYGEDFKEDYNDIWKSLKAKGNFTLADLEKAWNKSYGEAFKHEYSGLYKELMNESLVTEGKTDAIYKFLESLWEDAVDGVEYDENHGYTSRSFSDYWKKNQGKIIANFNKI